MIPLAAITVGSELPQADFAGVVHSVFDRAANIQLADGCLATCTVTSYFQMPRGIRVRTEDGFRFRSLLTEGAGAYCRGGILRFAGSDLKIDLRGVPVWNNGFTVAVPPSHWQLQKLWRAALGQMCFGFEFPRREILALLTGSESNQRRNARQSLRGLIGRGPGLTPAGDDVIAGVLAAPKLLAPMEPWSRGLGLSTLQHLQGTNVISRQMLCDAALGKFVEPILSLMSAIYGTGHVGHSVQRLLSVGATSGAAMLLGLIAGIALVEDCQLQTTANSPEPILSAGLS